MKSEQSVRSTTFKPAAQLTPVERLIDQSADKDRQLTERLGLAPGQSLLLDAYDPTCSARIKTETLSVELGTALVKRLGSRARAMARAGRIPVDRARSILVHAALARFLADTSQTC